MISSQRILPLCVLLTLSACQCTVNPDVDPLSIVVEPATLSLVAGGEAGALTAHRVNGEDVTNLVTWSSENDTIAKVEGGLVTGLARGTLTINAQLNQYSAGAGIDVTQIDPTCADGKKNGAETDIDCGGPACGDCTAGQICNIGNDCSSGICAAGVCMTPPSCNDRQRNGTESGVDCGGHECPACGTGETCGGNLDCSSRNCVLGLCAAATCNDQVKNGTETGTDCGGLDCPRCASGLECSTRQDCDSNVCTNGVCQAATCFDTVQNGGESGTDCGGPHCPACSTGGGCRLPTDCVERVCANGVCQAASCTDGVLNGNESDLDCGGSCPGCQTGGGCNGANDCGSGVCSMNVCLAPTCSDGVKNGRRPASTAAVLVRRVHLGPGLRHRRRLPLAGLLQPASARSRPAPTPTRNGQETGTDCGGAVCPACGPGGGCVGSQRLQLRRVRRRQICQLPTCTDAVRNGSETDIDCGGGACPVCPNGGSCSSGADCTSGVCSNGTCVLAACTDGVKNGQETGLDCGGARLRELRTGQTCSVAADCTSRRVHRRHLPGADLQRRREERTETDDRLRRRHLRRLRHRPHLPGELRLRLGQLRERQLRTRDPGRDSP